MIKEGIKTYLPKSEESKPPMSEEKLGSLSRTERKPITNKPLGSQGPKQVEKWQNNQSVYNNYNVRDDSSEDQLSEDVYKGYGGG